MSKKKNYLSNAELREEILKCITDGYEKRFLMVSIPNFLLMMKAIQIRK